MSNEFYNHGSYPTPNSPGSSAQLRAELDKIGAGFDKLPALTGNANKIVAVDSGGTALTVVNVLPSLDVIDATFLIQDNADTTKKARFEVGGVTAGTTRVFSLPDANATLVGEATTQTLTNKTLTAPVVSGGTVDNTVIGGTTPAAGTFSSLSASSGTISGSAITTAANTQTLTNKTLTSPQINNGFMSGGSIDNVTIGGGTPAAGTFTTLAATSGTIGTDTIVTRTAAQTLTNKTLTSPVVSGGTVDSATIGGTTPGAGTFTSLAANSATVGGAAVTTASNTQTLTNKSISGSSNTITGIQNTSLVNSSITIGSSSVSLGGSVSTIAGLTLTSSTLTSPTIAAIVNVGTLTLPTSTDTLIGRNTTDTLTNKTISGASNTLSNIPNTAITGLGTMSTQNANSVNITGGSVVGITDLTIADGGTGASTASAARVNLLPSYTGNALKVLRLNSAGTDVEWTSPTAGTVTSVAVSSSDLTVSGSPITSSGTISLSLNTVGVAKGGTGATTASGARVNLLPSYTGNALYVLRLNSAGTDVEWAAPSSSGTVTNVATGTGLTGGPITTTGTIAVDTAVVATTSNTLTMSNKTLTAPAVSGGTIDNAVIGGTTAAAGTFTSLTSSSTTSLGATTASSLTSNGALTLSGGGKIIADFTSASRSLVQTSTTNGNTFFAIVPNGTATNSQLQAFGTSDIANAPFGALIVNSTQVRLQSSITGTGTQLPLTFYIAGNEAARVDTSLNVVVGTAQLADSATNGFLYIPGTTTGAPTGTPTAYTGRHPMVYDDTNKVLYLHDGTNWVGGVGLTAVQTLTNKTLGSGTAITAGTINGVTIGGSSAGAGTFTDLTATGNVVLGDATTDTLQIGGNTITWSGTPTHSSNHTFSGSVTVLNDMQIGDVSTDALSIYPNAVTWANNPTHSGNHTFSGNVTVNGATGLTLSTKLTVANGGTGVATLTGIVKGNGTSAFSAATAGTDYTSPTGTETLSNKRFNPRVSSTTSTASLTPDISAYDQYNLTAQAVSLAINAPTGAPVDGNKLLFRILDNGTPQSISWNGTYTAIGVTLPTTTTANKTVYVGCVYNNANTRWDVVAVTTQG